MNDAARNFGGLRSPEGAGLDGLQGSALQLRPGGPKEFSPWREPWDSFRVKILPSPGGAKEPEAVVAAIDFLTASFSQGEEAFSLRENADTIRRASPPALMFGTSALRMNQISIEPLCCMQERRSQ